MLNMTRSSRPRSTSRSTSRTACAALAVVGAGALGACGADVSDLATEGRTGDSAAAGPWSWTDDTGATLELDHRPVRVAAFADQALALLSYGITPVAIFGRVDVATDPRFEDYDLDDVAIVGTTYGEIDLEALAAAAPELVVTGIYPTDREGTLDTSGPYYGVADAEQQSQLERIAPVGALAIGGSAEEVVEHTTALAEQLGADAAVVADGRAGYDEAAARLAEVAAAHPDIEVTQMYADASGIYVVKPADEPETRAYGDLGVVWTDAHPAGDYYWDIYSWENAARMATGDLLLTNVEGFGADELAEQPTFAEHPALVAGQVHDWNGAAMDYASQAEQMEDLADLIEGARDVA